MGFAAPFATHADPLDDLHQLGPDSAPHEGVPQGQVVGPLTVAR